MKDFEKYNEVIGIIENCSSDILNLIDWYFEVDFDNNGQLDDFVKELEYRLSIFAHEFRR